MKKWLVLLIIAGLIGVVYYLVVNYVEYTPKWLSGEKTKVQRGDIRSPISASGRVEPAEKIEIKSEASGEVTRILVKEGDYVYAGEVLVVLDPNDEKRSVDIAELQLEDASTQLLIAEEQARRSETVLIDRAKANVAAAEADFKDLNTQYERIKKISANARSDWEASLAQAARDGAKARLDAAIAALRVAESDAVLARHQADLAKKAVETAKRNFDDAQERLSETTIRAPCDGMVSKVAIQVGTLVQSGTKSLTGGTPLLRLADTKKLYVVAMVDDADFGTVRRIAPPAARPQLRPAKGRERNLSLPATKQAGNPTASAPRSPTTLPLATGPSDVDLTQRVKVLVDTFPDEEFWGVIERIDPEGEIHGAIVQYRVHVRLTSRNSFEMLQLNLPAQVEFTAESRKNVLKVESRCVRKQGDDFGVFVPDPTPEDKLNTRFVTVRTGITDGTYTEILPGSELKEGDEVYLQVPRPPSERGK